jgi:CDP-paratose 2-epimerase
MVVEMATDRPLVVSEDEAGSLTVRERESTSWPTASIDAAAAARRAVRGTERRSVITGGAGFIGTNLADRLIRDGGRVTILDDLSSPSAEANLQWLRGRHEDHLRVEVADVREVEAVRRVVQDADQVFHLAAQVAISTAVRDPVADFAVNLAGTVTLLEELRRLGDPPPLLYASTNKVYGSCRGIYVEQKGERYEPVDAAVRQHGISEDQPLQFVSPYACSKGGADQYVMDYAETYGMPTVVFRLSSVYGPHQAGHEDQAWLVHFLTQALAQEPITLYGDGRQVRDVLFVDELLDAMQLGIDNADRLAGSAFNIGGGPRNALSLLELLSILTELGAAPEVRFGDWRVGDQRYYASDTRRFAAETGWAPAVSPQRGVALLHDWLASSRAAAWRAS